MATSSRALSFSGQKKSQSVGTITMTKNCKPFTTLVLTCAWWVSIYSNQTWLHGGVFSTREQCERAKTNLIASFTSLGYPNVRGFCTNHNPNEK